MQTNTTNNVRQEKPQMPAHDPLAGVEETPVDAGAAEGADKQADTHAVQPQRISREAAEKGIAPDPDPDDPVSP